MLRIVLSFAVVAVMGCSAPKGLQSFYILDKDQHQIQLVQVRARGLAFTPESKLQELARLHCVGPAQLTETRTLPKDRGGHKVYTYACLG